MDKRHVCLLACVALPILLILAIFSIQSISWKIVFFVAIIVDIVYVSLQIRRASFDAGFEKRPVPKPAVESFGVYEVMDVRTQLAEDQEYVLIRRRRIGGLAPSRLKKKGSQYVEVVACSNSPE